jgi:hypothetical protein
MANSSGRSSGKKIGTPRRLEGREGREGEPKNRETISPQRGTKDAKQREGKEKVDGVMLKA